MGRSATSQYTGSSRYRSSVGERRETVPPGTVSHEKFYNHIIEDLQRCVKNKIYVRSFKGSIWGKVRKIQDDQRKTTTTSCASAGSGQFKRKVMARERGKEAGMWNIMYFVEVLYIWGRFLKKDRLLPGRDPIYCSALSTDIKKRPRTRPF